MKKKKIDFLILSHALKKCKNDLEGLLHSHKNAQSKN